MYKVHFVVSGYNKFCIENVNMTEELIKGFKSIKELAEYLRKYNVQQRLYPEYNINNIFVDILLITQKLDDNRQSHIVWEDAEVKKMFERL